MLATQRPIFTEFWLCVAHHNIIFLQHTGENVDHTELQWRKNTPPHESTNNKNASLYRQLQSLTENKAKYYLQQLSDDIETFPSLYNSHI